MRLYESIVRDDVIKCEDKRSKFITHSKAIRRLICIFLASFAPAASRDLSYYPRYSRRYLSLPIIWLFYFECCTCGGEAVNIGDGWLYCYLTQTHRWEVKLFFSFFLRTRRRNWGSREAGVCRDAFEHVRANHIEKFNNSGVRRIKTEEEKYSAWKLRKKRICWLYKSSP